MLCRPRSACFPSGTCFFRFSSNCFTAGHLSASSNMWIAVRIDGSVGHVGPGGEQGRVVHVGLEDGLALPALLLELRQEARQVGRLTDEVHRTGARFDHLLGQGRPVGHTDRRVALVTDDVDARRGCSGLELVADELERRQVTPDDEALLRFLGVHLLEVFEPRRAGDVGRMSGSAAPGRWSWPSRPTRRTRERRSCRTCGSRSRPCPRTPCRPGRMPPPTNMKTSVHALAIAGSTESSLPSRSTVRSGGRRCRPGRCTTWRRRPSRRTSPC